MELRSQYNDTTLDKNWSNFTNVLCFWPLDEYFFKIFTSKVVFRFVVDLHNKMHH